MGIASTVLVLRESQGAQRTVTQLYERGYEPLCAPLFTYEAYNPPLPESFSCALGGEILVLTSSSALRSESVRSLMRQRPLMPVVAVGDHTAEEARHVGAQMVISAGGDRHSLQVCIRTHHAPPARLLWAAGRHHKPDFVPQLLVLGYDVTVWEVYTMEALATLPDVLAQALHRGEVGVVLHYSRRSAEVLCALVREAGIIDLLSTWRHLCISADTAEPLLSFGIASCSVAPEPTEAALLACLGDL